MIRALRRGLVASYSPRVLRERPTRRQLVLRRAVVGGVALVLVALVALVIGRLADEPDTVTADTSTTTTSSGLGSATTAPSEVTTVADPLAVTVLVNKVWRLPPGWEPPDLVEPAVAFTFAGDEPKRRLREPAARALESLFGAAAEAGTPLAAVSGYRSEQTQADLFARAVERQGEAQAAEQHARPGHSEHQTGLAMDVTGADGSCAVEDCFAATPAAAWLAAHAAEHGFVVRYPAGKEAITGYAHEPWHRRSVGTDLAQRLASEGRVLEELST